VTVAPPGGTRSVSADAAAYSAVRDVCRRHAKDFFFASAFLTQPKRNGVYALYAFCRMIEEAIGVDDASLGGAAGLRHHPAVVSPASLESGTGCGSGSSLQSRLDMLRERLDEIYDGRLELPQPESRSQAQHVLHALGWTVRRYEIPRQLFLELAEGHRMDAAVSRYATWKSLKKYCYHTGGVIGLMTACVLGMTNSGAGGQAVEMGNAMRFTKILRDVRRDWRRGRVYLPLEDMVRFRYAERDLGARVVNDHFRDLMRFEIDRARRMYREAAEGVCWLAGDGTRLAASAIALLHAGTLAAIERRGYDVLSRPVRPTGGQTFRRLSAAWRLARRPAQSPVPDVFS
jgi:phytoene synthase